MKRDSLWFYSTNFSENTHIEDDQKKRKNTRQLEPINDWVDMSCTERKKKHFHELILFYKYLL